MTKLLSDSDEMLLKKWAALYARRWYVWTAFAGFAVFWAVGGTWRLMQTILEGRRIGLSAIETLLGMAPEPLDIYRLLAMASSSYTMLLGSFLSVVFMYFCSIGDRRYRVVRKLLQRLSELGEQVDTIAGSQEGVP
jgi:hypothetical protein